jgi:hypothetical protein
LLQIKEEGRDSRAAEGYKVCNLLSEVCPETVKCELQVGSNNNGGQGWK